MIREASDLPNERPVSGNGTQHYAPLHGGRLPVWVIFDDFSGDCRLADVRFYPVTMSSCGDTLAGNYLDFVQLASIRPWLAARYESTGYFLAARGSSPALLIASDARADERNSISRLPACASFESATTAAEKV